MNINIYDEQSDLLIDSNSAQALVREFFLFKKLPVDEVSIYFISDEEMCVLHEEFFQDPTSTDCISFPIDSPDGPHPIFLGEVFVCPKTAIAYCEAKGFDVYKELSLYVVHGLLHCLGYDDMEPKKKQQMRKQEKLCLTHLEKQNCLIKSRP